MAKAPASPEADACALVRTLAEAGDADAMTARGCVLARHRALAVLVTTHRAGRLGSMRAAHQDACDLFVTRRLCGKAAARHG
jgi:hypothetical protein